MRIASKQIIEFRPGSRLFILALTFVSSLVQGCATGPDSGPEEVVVVAAQGDHESELRGAALEYIAQEERSRDRAELSFERPYYFKLYAEYDDPENNMTVDIREQESQTTPYVADVRVDKTRFSTRLRRDREEAALDNDFLRDIGTETITFELRHGSWRRVGSLFVADRTEQLVAGEWVPVQDEPERTVAAEERRGEPGFFQRTLNALQFWR